MAKCIKCGKSTLVKGHVKLADAAICTFCFKGLGFTLSDVAAARSCTYDEIKDGKEIMIKKLEIKHQALKTAAAAINNYGQERERIATEAELEIFEILKEISGEDLQLIRRSDDYVTAALGEWDLARIKYTPRAKWVLFPSMDHKGEKMEISAPDDVYNFADLVENSLAVIRKYT